MNSWLGRARSEKVSESCLFSNSEWRHSDFECHWCVCNFQSKKVVGVQISLKSHLFQTERKVGVQPQFFVKHKQSSKSMQFKAAVVLLTEMHKKGTVIWWLMAMTTQLSLQTQGICWKVSDEWTVIKRSFHFSTHLCQCHKERKKQVGWKEFDVN